MDLFSQMASDAVARAKAFPANLQNSIVLANLMGRLMKPMLKNVSEAGREFKMLTHGTAGSTSGAAASETSVVNIDIPAAMDFLCTHLSWGNDYDYTGAHQYELQVQFLSGDRNLVNGRSQGFHGALCPIGGIATIPWVPMPVAQVMRRQERVSVTLTTLGTVAITNFMFYLLGKAVYDVSMLDNTMTMATA